MNLIEKAAAKLGRGDKTSLVEKLAERMDTEPSQAPAEVNGNTVVAPSPAPTLATAEALPADVAKKADAAAAAPKKGPRRSRRVTIDFDRLRSLGVVTYDAERSRLAEEYRFIKRPLLLKAFARGPDAISNGHLIMVTSSNPREGKTFTSVNLAMSIATERDLTVLLVDADASHPSIMPFFGIEAEIGLIDLLERDDVDVADVLLRTNRENLIIIPAGHANPYATELLASDRMARFVADVGKRYPDRVIIFDSPPVLATSEASVMAGYVGQIVFVVEAERTSQAAIASALNLIGACKNIGLLLNRTRTRADTDSMGSYYDYGQ